MKKVIILLGFIYIFLVLVGCENNNLCTKSIYLNEVFSIIPRVIIVDKEEKIDNCNLYDELNNILNDLNKKFNVNDKNSLISKVNENAGIQKTIVDKDFINLLNIAIDVSENTKVNNKSLYDITVFSLWEIWGFKDNYFNGSNFYWPPDDEIIKQKLPLVNYQNIDIDEENNTVYLKNKGMKIDLGSIVKGYASDILYSYLSELGFKNFIIDIGGNIVTSGKNKITNKKWKIGIKQPFTFNDEVGYVEALESKETFVTSGIYERYIMEEKINNDTNKKEYIMYHHLIDPITGYPKNNNLYSVTIICNNSMIADAYSTAIFLMGLEQGLQFVNENITIEAVFLTKDKKIYLSDGITERFVGGYTKYKIINNNLL